MSGFDPGSLLSAIDQDLVEALVETMYLAADSDGDFTEEERVKLAESIRTVVGGSPHEASLQGDAIGTMLQRAAAHQAAEGRSKRLEAVRQRLGAAASRKAAFGLSVWVAAADGIVRTSEREFFFELAEALEVDRDEAADLVRELTRG